MKTVTSYGSMNQLRKWIPAGAFSILLSMLLMQQLFSFSLFANPLASNTQPDPVQQGLIELVEWATQHDAYDEPIESNEELPSNPNGTEEERQETETSIEKISIAGYITMPAYIGHEHNAHLLVSIPAAFCSIFTPPPEFG